jgi:hypothetical protein
MFAYLSTLVGMRLLRSAAVGTKLLSLRPDLLLKLPIPEVESGRRAGIARALEAAVDAQAAAEHGEAEAIRLIEEEVLPQWLA